MSIQSEITRLSGNVSDALTAIAAKGVTVPPGSNSDNLATLIAQISGGGGSAQIQTGSFTGNNGRTVDISCSFAPDMIYVYGDLSGSASLRGVISLTILKDTELILTSDGSQSAVQEALAEAFHGITGYNENNSGEPYAEYSAGVLTINTVENTSSKRFTSGITYSYKLVKWTA